MKRLILASASPRRAELLSRLGFRFETEVLDYEDVEIPSGEGATDPAAYALATACAKLGVAMRALRADHAVVVCADTVVAIDGRIFGKPVDDEAGRRMLRVLSGKKHYVHTGVAVGETPGGHVASFVETTGVEFVPLPDEWIDAYIATGEHRDKAGAYGIQGRAGAFAARVEGCFSNVVGLPAGRLARLLADEFGLKFADFWREPR